MQDSQHVVLIPAYQPSEGLTGLVRDLSSAGMPVVVVDDGSGPEFRALFERAAQFPGVQVLRHAVNLGKGAALKTGINHALDSFPDLTGMVTADADGQHRPDDIQRVAQKQREHPEALVMGVRAVDAEAPLRRRFGSLLTRRLMHALTGAKLRGTETGLRGIPVRLAERLLRVEARGYEFELEMLAAARQTGVPLVEVPIRAISQGGKKYSQFNPLTDSMKMYFVLLRGSSVSLLTALLDNLIFYLVWKRAGHVLGALVLARVASVVFNYPMVRARVFASRERHGLLLPRYLLLVLASGTASYLGIRFITSRMQVSPVPVKWFVETMLFLVNFAVQRTFIFGRREGRGESAAGARARRLYGWLILGTLAVPAGVEAYGFRTSHLFAQEVWYPQGYARLLQFGSLFAAAAAGLLILAPWSFAGLAAALLACATLFCLGPAACGAVVFYLLSAWSLGRLAGRRWGMPHALSVLLGASVYIFAMTLAARVAVHYAWVYALVLALPVLANLGDARRQIPAILRLPARMELRTWGERLGGAALLFVLATHWFAMLKPEASADGLSMHLAVPADIAAHHMMTYDPGRILWSVMPMGADFTYSIVNLLGGEMAARLLNFTILLCIARAVARGGAALGDGRRGAVAGGAVRHHSDGATGHRLAIRGESADGAIARHDDGLVALRRARRARPPVCGGGAGRNGDVHQVRRHGICGTGIVVRGGRGVAAQGQRRTLGAGARAAAGMRGATLHDCLGEDWKSVVPEPQREISVAAIEPASRDPRRPLPQAPHLEYTLRPDFPQQSTL